jgi:NADPH:quinone reductase-like Zn-dependent oxidoreductase
VYFVLPEAPFGAFAEKCIVKAQHCIPLPDDLDDITAAAIANPGMSAWAALMERAHLKAGETVLVNGANGTGGRLAVQLAKYLGAAKVIATRRNEAELQEVKALGADVAILFTLGTISGNCKSQNGRGGLFFMIDDADLSNSVKDLISGGSAPTSP